MVASGRGFLTRQRLQPVLDALPALLLVLGIARQLAVNLRWVAQDQRVGASVASGMTWWLNEAIHLHGMGQLWAHRTGGHEPLDLFSLSGLGGWLLLGREPDAVLWVTLGFLAASQLLLLDVGRRLGSSWAGLVAALLLAMVPEISSMSRCWAPQLPQIFLLRAAVDCLLASRSLSRPLPTLGFAIAATAGVVFTQMKTDNLLFSLAVAGMGAGSWARGLVLGRGPLPGQVLPRWRSALLGFGAVWLVLAGSWLLYWRWMSLDYYGLEMSSPAYRTVATWWQLSALSAYGRWLFWYGLGPVLGAAMFFGLGLFCWRGSGRAELLGWAALPLAVLSVIYKKNPYYIAGIYPALLLTGVLGLRALGLRWPRLRAPVWLGLALVVGVVWSQWEAGSSADAQASAHHRLPDHAQVFQTFHPPVLRPSDQGPDGREIELIRQSLDPSSCPTGRRICFSPRADDTAQVLVGHTTDPCLVHDADDGQDNSSCDLVLLRDERCTPTGAAMAPPAAVRALRDQGFAIETRDHGARPCLWMLVRTP